MIAFGVLTLVLAVQLCVLWRKVERLEREKTEIARMAQDRVQDAVNRILVLKGVRPIAEPVLDAPVRIAGPVYTADELDNLRDMVRERLEVAQYRGEAITEAQAKAEVWAGLGFQAAPVEL